MEHGCAVNEIVNPQSSLRNIQSEEFTNGDESTENIQLKPQEVEIRVRPSNFVILFFLNNLFGSSGNFKLFLSVCYK